MRRHSERHIRILVAIIFIFLANLIIIIKAQCLQSATAALQTFLFSSPCSIHDTVMLGCMMIPTSAPDRRKFFGRSCDQCASTLLESNGEAEYLTSFHSSYPPMSSCARCLHSMNATQATCRITSAKFARRSLASIHRWFQEDGRGSVNESACQALAG
ncbi:hypothetical protein BJ875DRAFT_487263 [Amylocarpus encephaloides]|uniref:Uncharacterized protein n=1 Tax=Amylocarpus encephaloides TaxID=45428 RepID=A0A9P7YDR8_9HELO|nr:hypothetical protein BJ875DRAFT_487263 [Amylocarpus encephaloides]